MTPFAIAGIQMPLSGAAENVTAMGRRLDILMARYPWVQMVLFSELAAFGPLPQFAQALPGPAEATFQAMAARHGIWLIPGSLYEKKGGKIFNTAPVIDPRGAVIARYRKLFPFRPYEQATTPGEDFVIFDVPDGRAASVFRSATTCGSRRRPAPWPPWVPKSSFTRP